MGFVRTRQEIRKIQHALSRPRFVNAEMLSVEFLTRPAVIRRLLPPGLESTGNPRVTAMVGRWQSNCVGDFDGGAIYLEAKHKKIVGDYVLAMYMDRDQPIIYGRELFGEPKKEASTRLFRRGDQFSGRVERHGTPLIELEVDVTADHGPTEGEGVNFNYKAIPATHGIGFEWDPVLTCARFALTLRSNLSGRGALRLGRTVHDPLDEIPIVKVLRGAYTQGDLVARAETLARVDPAKFLPYALGRTDDWSALDTENRSLRT
ncbi:MAG: acetoacetate decarboxylase family protein [Gammaproteobacteria bacterium]